MKKKFFKILIVLMTISLVGLIIVQLYWLKKAFDAKESEFDSRVYRALDETAMAVRQHEVDRYYKYFNTTRKTMRNSAEKPEVITSQIESDSANVKYVYITRYMMDKIKLPISGIHNDSLKVTQLYSSEKAIKVKKHSSLKGFQPLPIDLENEFKDATYTIERFAKLYSGNTPISKRIDFKAIDSIFSFYQKKWNVSTEFKLAVLNADSTSVALKENGYIQENDNFLTPLFSNSKNKVSYYLSVYLPQKRGTILSAYSGLATLTIFFTLTILCVYVVSIYIMVKQRQISQMKTDFMNNMTHEFKTPIATISVAADALKSPVVSKNPEKIKHYANLIKQENKRMNQQVENVLRISKLERREIVLDKSMVEMNDLVKDSVDSIRLIVENRNGTIFEKYNVKSCELSVDGFHMGNIILNVLENATKYSPEAPEISVTTYIEDNKWYVIKIQDKGMGMSKHVMSRIFEKFYRAETGNIHNVKGHGLGLAYVKHIMDLHKGIIEVESHKGKGTTFYLKLSIN
ncbi:sensor histidine kinase [Ornithobacterium rhinotracheale]|nr:sensor histidine kinase [Ornithobacterium rhinotracheale]